MRRGVYRVTWLSGCLEVNPQDCYQREEVGDRLRLSMGEAIITV